MLDRDEPIVWKGAGGEEFGAREFVEGFDEG